MNAPERARIGQKATWNAQGDDTQIGQRTAECCRPYPGEGRRIADPPPELRQPVQSVGRLVAGDERAVDGADGGADDPFGFDARFAQGLVDARLIGAQRAAALQHQHDLAGGMTGADDPLKLARHRRWARCGFHCGTSRR